MLSVCFQDNVLAAEKPPDAPSQEMDTSDVFLKKDDFLFDPFDPWKGPQSGGVSENDVFMFDESTAPPPPPLPAGETSELEDSSEWTSTVCVIIDPLLTADISIQLEKCFRLDQRRESQQC